MPVDLYPGTPAEIETRLDGVGGRPSGTNRPRRLHHYWGREGRGWESKRPKERTRNTEGKRKAEAGRQRHSGCPSEQASPARALSSAQPHRSKQPTQAKVEDDEEEEEERRSSQTTAAAARLVRWGWCCLGRWKGRAVQSEMAMESKVLDCWWLIL